MPPQDHPGPVDYDRWASAGAFYTIVPLKATLDPLEVDWRAVKRARHFGKRGQRLDEARRPPPDFMSGMSGIRLPQVL